MNSSDLTRQQAEMIRDRIANTRAYLCSLMNRMHQQGFPADDPRRVTVKAAHDGMDWLWVEAHYLSCGVGKVE